MSMTKRAALAALLSLGLAAPALAQNFPTKPITVIVSYAAGGPSDVIARLLGEQMSKALGQPVVVENVAGAGGTAGAKRAAAAEPDGHTILIHHLALAAAPALYNNLGYDTKTAFAPIGLVNTGPMVIASKLALPPTDAKSFFPYIKANAEKLTVAHAGVGSNSHLCAVLMSQQLGAKFNQVAYRGTGPAMNDLVGGQIDILCDQSTSAIPQITGKSIRAYAVTSAQRLSVLPDVPTMAEAGAKLDMTIWHGLYAPKGTPAPVLDKLNAALRTALKAPAVVEKFQAFGTSTFPESEMTREAHAKLFAAEVDKWATSLAAAGVKPQG
ncbi:MAG TPA: tripartite tricarboxylate transporter substrate-binding protein [Bosea sp. (in: a-proteobacteria)]|uniref:tripartite tricarboxylate transporter substrate-binding protein n=1 Tax=Bosea sp. (in: a-proteobacteria) TaxID=1871050 RepID=UPI002DDC983E|nr:tripartite tricarboxylate transporter substrate-binding protein [Bosea sp. (in: a-proteobacteria)]HEV2556333.1 tripartite tricarboxylate transporter substrate-binding protein [Bosea sp. (in: a-proteobacteria)]